MRRYEPLGKAGFWDSRFYLRKILDRSSPERGLCQDGCRVQSLGFRVQVVFSFAV